MFKQDVCSSKTFSPLKEITVNNYPQAPTSIAIPGVSASAVRLLIKYDAVKRPTVTFEEKNVHAKDVFFAGFWRTTNGARFFHITSLGEVIWADTPESFIRKL